MKTASSEVMRIAENLVRKRLERRAGRRPVSCSDLEAAMYEVLRHAERREHSHRNGGEPQPFRLLTYVRGAAVLKGTVIVSETAEADAAYARALSTQSGSGAFLVPTIQANAIIAQLSQVSTLRAAGCRIWPMENIQQLDVPASLAAPTAAWQPESGQWSSSDPNFSQINFNLKTCGSFLALPAQLYKTMSPSLEDVFETAFIFSMGEAEDAAVHAAATVANGPLALLSAAGITTVNVGSSANGGNVGWPDVLGVIQKSIDLKVPPVGLAWFCAGRTFNRLLSLQDGQSRQLLLPIPELVGAGGAQAAYGLFGHPIFPSVSFPLNETLGSGTNQSHMVLAPPSSLHIGESGEIALDVSMNRYWDFNEVGVRISHKIATGFAPVSSIVALLGIN
jgi:HK97 family phage major capsid protein